MKICIKKKYRTRDGSKVTIYRTDAKDPHPVHGCVTHTDGEETLECWTSEGVFYSMFGASEDDLVDVPPRIKFHVWLNVYEHNVAMSFATLEAADQAASQVFGRLACIPVTVDCSKGEGIDDEDS